MFGSHLSIAGDMTNALREGERLGMDTVQVFTKNQQQWRVAPLADELVHAWKGEIARLSWEGRTVSHASYLINLASPDDELWKKSIDLMRVEIERCEALEIPFLVHHPGAYTTSDAPSGLGRIADAYRELFKSTRGFRCVSCLEDTAGAGSHLGRTLEELADLRRRIIDAAGTPERVGFCLDTCHLHAGGYDLTTRKGGEEVLDRFGNLCGMETLRVLHMNDSKGACGSRLDRHAHIGEGTIGGSTNDATLRASGFAAFVNHPALKNVPKILETPKEDTEAGTPMDVVNLARLRRLVEAPGGTGERGAKRPKSRRTP